jgi:hypothetical protein
MRRAVDWQIDTEIYGGPLRSLRIWSAISWIFRSVCCRVASAFEVRAAARRSRQVGSWLVRSAGLDRLNQPTIPSLLPHRAVVTYPKPTLGLSMPRRTRDVHRAGDEAVSGPAAGARAPGLVLVHLRVNPCPCRAGNNRSGKGSSPQPITGCRAARPAAGRTGTAVTCIAQTAHRPAIGILLMVLPGRRRRASRAVVTSPARS